MEDALDEMYKNVNSTGRAGIMGKCPRCRAPFEKDGGCPIMSCTICQYTYCWVCGMKDGTLHDLIGGPMMCSLMIEVIALPTWLSFIMHILAFIFLPLAVVIGSIAGAGYLAFICLESTCDSKRVCLIPFLLQSPHRLEGLVKRQKA